MKATKKPRKPARYIEQKLQEALVAHIRKCYRKQVHIVGSFGTSTSAREGSKKKKLGYEVGDPDLTVFSKIKPTAPLFIELKRPKTAEHTAGTESPEQRLKRQEFIQIGYSWVVIDDLAKGVETIKEYFDL